jgi:hypothetical protein
MATRFPPRYLPTLTEVVSPELREALTRAKESNALSAPSVPTTDVEAETETESRAVADRASVDRDTLARQVIELVTPQLEAELRSVARELFEVQYNAMLPSLHLQIQEAVREAIDLALPDSYHPQN